MSIDDLLFAIIIAGVSLTGIQFRVEYLCRHPKRKPRRAARPDEIGPSRRAFTRGVRSKTAVSTLLVEPPTLQL
jgi:hypothetical protein